MVGGHVAVDFVNTLGGSPDRADDEYLFEYVDLLDWLTRAGHLPPDRRRSLGRAARKAPAEAARVLHDVRRLRDAVDHILRRHRNAEPVDAGHLELVRSAYADATGHATLAVHGASYRLGWDMADGSLRWPMWVIAAACVDLLADAPLGRLGRCEHCRWLYLDRSRNHSRRWCSMNACGAVIKMRRHRAGRGARP